jgi:hypothetical protein
MSPSFFLCDKVSLLLLWRKRLQIKEKLHVRRSSIVAKKT